jgi:hypothetical protein
MIAHHTVSPILKAYEGHRAGPEGGTYICLFAHCLTREPLDQLAQSQAQSLKGFLKAVSIFRRNGGLGLWKGGEVKPNNRFMGRLDTLSSGIHNGRKDLPTAQKIHKRIIEQGGYALVMMFPVVGYTCEHKMMGDLVEALGMEFDNFGRDENCTKPVKKRWLPSAPARFTISKDDL